MKSWRARVREPELIANAREDFADLRPVSQLPAQQLAAKYEALLPGQEIPLIGEMTYGDGDGTDEGT